MLAINYSEDNRGVIQFRERRRQIVDFSGLRIGNITPTDCDGLIEYHGKAYVLFEIKYRCVKVPRGQLIALRRAVDDWQRSNKFAILIIAYHDVDNPAVDIVADQCEIYQYYHSRQFYTPPSHTLLGNFIRKVLNDIDNKNVWHQGLSPNPAPSGLE